MDPVTPHIWAQMSRNTLGLHSRGDYTPSRKMSLNFKAARVDVKSWQLHWRNNGRHCVSSHQPHHCLLYRLFRRGSKKTSKLRVNGLCERNPPGTDEFPAQMASNAENVSIWWRHHAFDGRLCRISERSGNFKPILRGFEISRIYGLKSSWSA